MGRKRKRSFDNNVPRDSNDFSLDEDELAIEVMRLHRALADMESFGHSQADQADFFSKANSIMDMEKVELKVEIEILHANNEPLRRRLATLEHTLALGQGGAGRADIIKEATYTVGDVLSGRLIGNICADAMCSTDDEEVGPSCPPVFKPLIG